MTSSRPDTINDVVAIAVERAARLDLEPEKRQRMISATVRALLALRRRGRKAA